MGGPLIEVRFFPYIYVVTVSRILLRQWLRIRPAPTSKSGVIMASKFGIEAEKEQVCKVFVLRQQPPVRPLSMSCTDHDFRLPRRHAQCCIGQIEPYAAPVAARLRNSNLIGPTCSCAL